MTFEQKLRGAEGFIVWASGEKATGTVNEKALRQESTCPGKSKEARVAEAQGVCGRMGAEGEETVNEP